MTTAVPAGSRALALGLLALVGFAPLVDAGTTYLSGTLIRLGAVSLALAWAWLALGGRMPARQESPADLPIVLFLVLACASALASDYTYLSLQAFHALAAAALVYAVTLETLRAPGQAGAIRGLLVGVALAESGLAVGQWLSGTGRPAGTYFNPNHLGLGLAMAACLLLAAAPGRGRRRALQVLGLVLLGGVLLLTRSRGAVLAAFAGMGLVGWHRWRWRAVAGAVLAAALLVTVPNPLTYRIRQIQVQDTFAYTRLEIWGTALQRVRDHPAGVGLNMFAPTAQLYAFEARSGLTRFGRRASNAHNEYLQILAELGPAGLGLALWAMAAVVLAARARLGRPDRDTVLPGAVGALSAFAVQAVVDTPASVPGLFVPAAALAAIVVGPGRVTQPAREAGAPAGLHRLGRAGVVLLALVALPLVARHGAAYLAALRSSAVRASVGPEAALQWLAVAERLAPDCAAYPDARAAVHLSAYVHTGEWRQAQAAEAAMLRAVGLDPLNSARLIKQAWVYTEVRDVDPSIARRALVRADELYREVSRLNPTYVGHAVSHAEVLTRLDEPAAAVAVLERATQVEPNLLVNRLALARLLGRLGHVDRARREYAAIEQILAAYDASGRPDPLAERYLGVDRAKVREEAARLGGRAS